MTRRIILISLFLLLFAQFCALLHNAGHGFGKHTHSGHMCSIYSYFKHNGATNLPESGELVILLVFASLLLILPKQQLLVSRRFLPNSPRAPPYKS